MSFDVSDSRTLERIAEALDRLADAEERRNKLLEADQQQRHAAWERERQEMAERWVELGQSLQPQEVHRADS